jgi:hypothetical protein
MNVTSSASGEKALANTVNAVILTIPLPVDRHLGGSFTATVYAIDATERQARSDHFTFAAINKAGAVTAGIQGTPSTAAGVSAGTLTDVWTVVANGNNIEVKLAATSSLTPTAMKVSWHMVLNGEYGDQIITR